jgi:hypothetical protein
MAYANDSALIAAVQGSAHLLGTAATWASGRPVNVTDDFLYEMYVLFRAVHDLMANYDIAYVAGVGAKTHVFPRKPANKAGRPRFHIRDKTTHADLFQMCPGTKASDIHGHLRGLDISIQGPAAPDVPGPADVLQIFDAKYRTKVNDRISHHEFSEFARWIELFQLRGVAPAGLIFPTYPELDANCLVTNGQLSTELDVECQRVSLSEVAEFHPTTAHHSRP